MTNLRCVAAAALLAVAFTGLTAVTASTATALDPSPWDRVLTRHARRGGLDYAALRADSGSMADLNGFVASLATMPETAPLSDWLNAYNAIVVKSVVARYPLRSVRDVAGFFDRTRHRVAGRPRTLDDIENRIIRPRFRDARIHAALNCAAEGCPPLHPRAFRQADLSRTLDALARAFVASPTHVRVEGGRLMLSELFFWFDADFVRDAGTVQAWIRRYDATSRIAAAALSQAPIRVPYRWQLNDRAARR